MSDMFKKLRRGNSMGLLHWKTCNLTRTIIRKLFLTTVRNIPNTKEIVSDRHLNHSSGLPRSFVAQDGKGAAIICVLTNNPCNPYAVRRLMRRFDLSFYDRKHLRILDYAIVIPGKRAA